MNKQLLSFSISNALFDLAYGVGKIFSILYFYQIFNNSIIYAIGAWLAVILLHSVFVWFAAHFMGKLGTRTSLIISTALFFISFVMIMIMDKANPLPYFLAWIVIYAMARSMYYIPYHLFAIHLTKEKTRGEEMSKVSAIALLLMLFIPFIGGTLSANFGFQGIGIFSGVVFLLSIFPLLRVPNYKFTYSGRLWDIFNMPPSRKEFKLLFINDLQNKESFWQIYVFIMLGGSFLNFGILFSIVNILSFAIIWITGRFIDHENLKKILHVDAIITSAVWILRIVVNNPIGVAISDTLYELVSTSRNQVAGAIDYQLITHENTIQLLDERLIAKEVFWNFFAGIATFFCLVLAVFIDIKAVFVVAALASLMLLAF